MATSKTGAGSGSGAQKSTGAAGGQGAAKSAGKSAAKGAAKGAGATKAASKAAGAAKKAAPRAGKPDLRSDVRGFVAGRPQGWNHDEWLGFLEELRSRGHNVDDRDAIGALLERERLGHALEKVPGIGAQRVRAIADRYGNIWRLKEASAEELARDANIPRPLAERIVESVR